MSRTSTIALLTALAGSAAFAHFHVTVDTTSGSQGDPITIRAGYYPDDAAYSIDPTGRLLESGSPAVVRPDSRYDSGPFAGSWLTDSPVLTSDYYSQTGRLDGGDFYYEVASVTPLNAPPAHVQWGDFNDDGDFIPTADSAGATRVARSFHVGVGSHDHEQAYTLSSSGIYDITLIAWDANARYADSQPITFRVNTCYANCDSSTTSPALTASDFICFLNKFRAGDDYANCDGSTTAPTLTAADFTCFLSAFRAGCP
jgi:hypothetical protein